MICPKCGHERTDKDDPETPEYQCPACGIIYAKFGHTPDIKAFKQAQSRSVAVESIFDGLADFTETAIDKASEHYQKTAEHLQKAAEERRQREQLNQLKNPKPSAGQIDIEFKRIAEKTGDDRFFTRKEFVHLSENLMPSEQIIAIASGLMEGNTWMIGLTDKRILFVDKGLLFGVKQASIDLDKVNTIAGTTGILFGKIVIQDGAASRVITNVPKWTVMPFTNLVRDAIEARKTPKSQPAQTSLDPIEKLEKLAALLEKGLLTQEEFDQQKKTILQNI